MKEKENYIIYSYVGCVDQNLIANINYNIKSGSLFQELDNIKSKRNKIIILAVEIVQNIIKHSNNYFEPESVCNPSEFFISYNKDEKTITYNIKNLLEQEALNTFIKKIEHTNSMNTEELNAAYKDQLMNGSLSEKHGAGLGLYEMRRIIKNKINYKIEKSSAKYTELNYSLTLNLQ
jgi:Family of unknown function (DUF6272)